MRTTFMNNEKRIRESKQRCSGKGIEEIYKPKWLFYKSLLFLKKACVQTESSSNLDVLEDYDNQEVITIDVNEEINNKLLADSVQKNMYFDSNLQKWILMLADTDALSCSRALGQDVSTPSLLNHTYSPEHIIEQFSAETNLLPTHMPTSNCRSHTSTERVEFPCTSLSSSEGTCMLDVINSKPSAFENRQNFCLTPVSSSHSPNPTSVIQNKKREKNKDLSFVKRGAMKKATIMEEAVEALKKISNEKMPQVLQSSSQISNTTDACEYLGLFIAARLREMEPDIRMRCEIEIMKILTTVATIETQEKNM